MEKQNAKFAFFYMLSLVALVFTSLAAAMVVFQIINKKVIDLITLAPGGFNQDALKFAISAIIIAAPIYFVMMWLINKNLLAGKMDKESGIRKWLTYFILLISAVVMIGWLIGAILYGNWFGDAIIIAEVHKGVATMAHEFHGVVGMMTHSVTTLPFWLAISGAATAWFLYIVRPDLPAAIKKKSGFLATILEEKYGFDRFNDWFFAGGARGIGRGLWKGGDEALIDGVMVNGSAGAVGWVSGLVRLVQTGHIYQYAFGMVFGVLGLLSLMWWLGQRGLI